MLLYIESHSRPFYFIQCNLVADLSSQLAREGKKLISRERAFQQVLLLCFTARCRPCDLFWPRASNLCKFNKVVLVAARGKNEATNNIYSQYYTREQQTTSRVCVCVLCGDRVTCPIMLNILKGISCRWTHGPQIV